VDKAKEILPAKFAIKGLDISSESAKRLQARKEEFQRDWGRNLRYLLPVSDTVSFEETWNVVFQLISEITQEFP